MHIQPKVSVESIDVNIYFSSQFYYKQQMMEHLRLTRVVETPSKKQKEKLYHNKNLKSAGNYENL